jgi:hypothetical protein
MLSVMTIARQLRKEMQMMVHQITCKDWRVLMLLDLSRLDVLFIPFPNFLFHLLQRGVWSMQDTEMHYALKNQG